jgi:hypothetical protein
LRDGSSGEGQEKRCRDAVNFADAADGDVAGSVFLGGKKAGDDTEDTVMEIYALTKFVVERSPSQVVGSLLRRKEGKVRILDSRCGISGEFGSAHHVDQTKSKQDEQKRRRQCTQRRHKAAPGLK